jgi:tetratricopeptide (TPR) repeat protein
MVRQCLQHIKTALKTADISSPDAILLTGGMTKLDALRKALQLNYPVPTYKASENDVALGCVAYGRRLPNSEQDRKESMAPKQTRSTLAEPPADSTGTGRWADNFMKFFDKAQQLEREKRFEECVATLDELFRELSLFCLQPFCHLASIYEKEGQYGRAFEILERLYRQNPEDHRISDYLINVSLKHFDQLYKEGNDPAALERAELAVSLLQKCDKCDPLYNKDLAIGIHRKASALYRLHRLKTASGWIRTKNDTISL